MFLQDISQS